MTHFNNGCCIGCGNLFKKYPDFYSELQTWFEALQVEHPEAHISCAGRGRESQEQAFQEGKSRAHYGQSAHNYNAAIDLFQLANGKALWEKAWFQSVVKPNLYPALEWYGESDAIYFELPHIQIRTWKDLRDHGSIHLVEK